MTQNQQIGGLVVGTIAAVYGVITTVISLVRAREGLAAAVFVAACVYGAWAVGRLFEKVYGRHEAGHGSGRPM